MEDETLSEPVKTREEFAGMLMSLREDLLQRPESWENNTLPRFLEAMAAYTLDISGYYRNFKIDERADEPTWQRFADILIGASGYE